jgi:hypothetical protein
MSSARKRAENAHSLKLSSIVRWVPVVELKIDSEAQRKLSMHWVKDRVTEFDPDKMGLIVVNKRSDGSTYVVDGQHRVQLVLALGWDDQQVQCECFEGLTRQEEAQLFLDRNYRRAVRPYDKFRIRLTAKEPIACDIHKTLERSGLKVSDNGDGVGSVSAVVALERIHNGAKISQSNGPKALQDALRIIIESWGKESTNFAGVVVEGIGLVKLRYGPKASNAALVKKLATIGGGAAGLIGRARASKDIHGQTMPRNVAAVIVDSYNRGKRNNKLENWWS